MSSCTDALVHKMVCGSHKQGTEICGIHYTRLYTCCIYASCMWAKNNWGTPSILFISKRLGFIRIQGIAWPVMQPGLAKIPAPDEGPGSDIIPEGLKIQMIEETIARCRMVPNPWCTIRASIFLRIFIFFCINCKKCTLLQLSDSS